MTLADILAETERQVIAQALIAADFNRAAAARQLGITSQSLALKLQRLSRRAKTTGVTITIE